MSGFKNFILRGNLVDLAVAVIIGTSFGAVVTTFTNWLKDLRDSRTDVNIDPIWSEYTPSIPAVPSDLQSAIFSS